MPREVGMTGVEPAASCPPDTRLSPRLHSDVWVRWGSNPTMRERHRFTVCWTTLVHLTRELKKRVEVSLFPLRLKAPYPVVSQTTRGNLQAPRGAGDNANVLEGERSCEETTTTSWNWSQPPCSIFLQNADIPPVLGPT